jgi:hypothetical protein
MHEFLVSLMKEIILAERNLCGPNERAAAHLNEAMSILRDIPSGSAVWMTAEEQANEEVG